MTQRAQVRPFVAAALRLGHDVVNVGGQVPAAWCLAHWLLVQYQQAQSLPPGTVATGR
jgi:hypothetical protein